MALEMNETREKLLALLADGKFHSGESLANLLALSRAAIHNNIEALERVGIEIFRVKGKGYRLQHPLILLDFNKINVNRNTPLHLFWQVDSTNAFLMQRRYLAQNGEACLAEAQTAGRGRRGRIWVSPPASHLYLSYFYRLEQGMTAAAGLSLAVGVMICDALAECGFSDVALKWPNDLYLDGKKLAGILVELNGQYGEAAELVIGCGINVSMPMAAAKSIDQPWIDLQSQHPERIDRNEIANHILRALDRGMSEFAERGLAPFVERWQQLDCFADQQVRLLISNRSILGVAKGIDKQGNLLLEHEGEVRAYASGEVSLRSA